MFILVFIDIYLFFSILWVGDISPWGIHPPYPLFHGGSEGWNPHTSCSTVGAKVRDRGGIRYEGRRYEGYIAPLAHRGTRGLGGWNPPYFFIQ